MRLLRASTPLSAFVALSLVAAIVPADGGAQGCEPIRFTTPINLGGEGEAYQQAREWQLTLAYRRLHSNEFFVGTQENPALGPGGKAPIFRIHTMIADVAYAFNDRYRLRVSVPFSKGSISKTWADRAIHEQTASGLGDVSVMGEAWLLAPRTHSRGNIAVGLGVKAPTGNHKTGSQFYGANGPVAFPAEPTIQPGDGGWALLVQSQAFRQVTDRTYAYVFGSYMMNPKAQTDVQLSPTVTTRWSVPDVYSARLGGAFAVSPDQGVTTSLGVRVDGIPVHDLLGSGDDSTIKRASTIVYADPGLSWTLRSSTLTVSVPWRLSVNRKKSLLEQKTNGLNAGGFAKYLVFVSVSHRL